MPVRIFIDNVVEMLQGLNVCMCNIGLNKYLVKKKP